MVRRGGPLSYRVDSRFSGGSLPPPAQSCNVTPICAFAAYAGILWPVHVAGTAPRAVRGLQRTAGGADVSSDLASVAPARSLSGRIAGMPASVLRHVGKRSIAIDSEPCSRNSRAGVH